MAMFAAVYVVISIIPGIPVAPGVEIQFEAGLASVMGVFLGPYIGFLTAFLSSTVSWLILGSGIFGLPFLFNPPLNALIVGFIVYKNRKQSLIIGVLAYAILIIFQLISPPLTTPSFNFIIAVAVLYDKIIGLALVFPVVILFDRLKDKEGRISLIKTSIIAFFLVALIGNIIDNLLGTALFSYPFVYQIYGFDLVGVQTTFLATPFIYLPIRIAQSIFATLVTIGLIKAFGRDELVLESLIK
jgi:hypothetical protein